MPSKAASRVTKEGGACIACNSVQYTQCRPHLLLCVCVIGHYRSLDGQHDHQQRDRNVISRLIETFVNIFAHTNCMMKFSCHSSFAH